MNNILHFVQMIIVEHYREKLVKINTFIIARRYIGRASCEVICLESGDGPIIFSW